MASVDVERFRASVKARCEKHGAIQKLATAAGISRVYLSEILNGHKGPSLDVALDVARALGVSIDDLTSPPSTPKKNLRKVS